MNQITVRAKTAQRGDQKIGGEIYSSAEVAFEQYLHYLKTYEKDILESVPESGEYITINFYGGDKYSDYQMRLKDIPHSIMIPIGYADKYTHG